MLHKTDKQKPLTQNKNDPGLTNQEIKDGFSVHIWYLANKLRNIFHLISQITKQKLNQQVATPELLN